MDDDDLYGGMAPFEKASDTSYAAALSLGGGRSTLRERVFRHILRCGSVGSTDDEVERALDLRHQTVSPRRRELVLLGAVVDSGRRRRTSSGRTAAVYVLAHLGDPMEAQAGDQ